MKFDTRKNIGNSGLSMAIAYFGSNGYTVLIPLNDTQDYDLVVDMDGKLKKIQLKVTSYKRINNAYQVQLRTISGTTRKPYKTVKDTNIDYLFCLCGDGTMYLIPIDVIKSGNSISLSKEKSKYSKEDMIDYSKYIVTFKKKWVDTGFVDCEHIDYIDVPNGTSEDDLNEFAREFMEDNINYGFEIVGDVENEA